MSDIQPPPSTDCAAIGAASGAEAGCAPNVSGERLADVPEAGVGGPKLKALADGWAVVAGAVRSGPRREASAVRWGAGTDDVSDAAGTGSAEAVSGRSVAVCCRAGTEGASAGLVTVPESEKSRSLASPTVSDVFDGAAGMAMFDDPGASASWASAGAAHNASATAAELTRNLCLMLTRWSGWGLPPTSRRLHGLCRPMPHTSSTCLMNRSRLAPKSVISPELNARRRAPVRYPRRPGR